MSARHRQHKQKLGAVQKDLAEREVDLVSYERVLADITRRRPSMFYTTIATVRECSDATKRDVEQLRETVLGLERTRPT